MIPAILIGLLAAFVTSAPAAIRALTGGSGGAWIAYSPALILGIAIVGVLIQRFVLDKRPGSSAYDGLADLLIHIHSPASPDSAFRWALRGVSSFLLAIFGVGTGPEGAAVEWGHAAEMRFRDRSARWFEHRRRTDAAVALSAGVSAAFGAPFAGMILPVEIEIGGRTIHSVVASLVAFLTGRFLVQTFALHHFDINGALFGFQFLGWRQCIGMVVIALVTGVIGAGVTRVVRFSQDSLLDLFQTSAWIRILFAGILLFLVGAIYRPSILPPSWILEEVLWGRRGPQEWGLLFCSGLLVFTLVVSGFGTIGVFWPLFSLGGILGFGVNHLLLQQISGFDAAAGLIGAAAFWGAVLGAPLSAAVLAFEMTGNLQILLACLVAGLLAREVRALTRTPAIFEKDLEARGVGLLDGRSTSVLSAVLVKDAMISDHETVHEHEPVSELYARLFKTRYAFLPVVDGQGKYIGMLTADMIQDAWAAQEKVHSNSPLTTLLEAKDLVYRAGLKVPTLHSGERLLNSSRLFSSLPCVPVLGDDRRVQGLLFAYGVRLAYDREVARRSMRFEKT